MLWNIGGKPMDDLISRQAVLNATSAKLKITGKENAETVYEYIKKLCDDIKALPSAQQWIPVEKETPILPNIVLVCDSLGKILFDSYIDGIWTYCPYVVAWMPLPEPYKEGNG